MAGGWIEIVHFPALLKRVRWNRMTEKKKYAREGGIRNGFR